MTELSIGEKAFAVFALLVLSGSALWDGFMPNSSHFLAENWRFLLPAFVGIVAFGILLRAFVRFVERRADRTTGSTRSQCAVCKAPVGGDGLSFGEEQVCPQCKDTYVQCLKEGVQPQGGHSQDGPN